MCKSLVWRGFLVGGLFLLFTAGVASSQMSPFPAQNTIAWGGPIQPDVGNTDNRSQSPAPAQPLAPAPAQVDANAESSSDTSAETPSGAQSASPAVSVDNSPPSTASDNNTVRQLGAPFPLQLQAEGLKIGPFYIPSISDSFWFASNSSPGQPTQTFAGNSITFNILASKMLNNGVLAFQAKEQFSLLNSASPYFNQSAALGLTKQLSERWSLTATANLTYFQNSILANPQYLFSYENAGANAGNLQQSLFVQQRSYSFYESNNVALSYSLNGRTQITLSPIIGGAFSYVPQQGWVNTHEFGGAVGVTRQITPNLTLGAFYSLSHSVTGGTTDAPSWNSQNLGFNVQYTHESWSFAASLAASGQLVSQVWTLTPTGSLRVVKKFARGSSILAAYSRSEAGSIVLSSGYFDQANVSYNQNLNRKLSFNAGVGTFRTVNTGTSQNGKTIGGGVNYQYSPRLSFNAGYNYGHQNGTETSTFFPLLGNTNSFNLGLTWLLGSHSGL